MHSWHEACSLKFGAFYLTLTKLGKLHVSIVCTDFPQTQQEKMAGNVKFMSITVLI